MYQILGATLSFKFAPGWPATPDKCSRRITWRWFSMDLHYPIKIILCGWVDGWCRRKGDVGLTSLTSCARSTHYAVCLGRGILLICSIRVTPSRASLRRKVVMHARLKLGSVCSIVYVCSNHGKVQYLNSIHHLGLRIRTCKIYDNLWYSGTAPLPVFRMDYFHTEQPALFSLFVFSKHPQTRLWRKAQRQWHLKKNLRAFLPGGVGAMFP